MWLPVVKCSENTAQFIISCTVNKWKLMHIFCLFAWQMVCLMCFTITVINNVGCTKRDTLDLHFLGIYFLWSYLRSSANDSGKICFYVSSNKNNADPPSDEEFRHVLTILESLWDVCGVTKLLLALHCPLWMEGRSSLHFHS